MQRRKTREKTKRRKSECSVGYGLVVQGCQKVPMLMQIEFLDFKRETNERSLGFSVFTRVFHISWGFPGASNLGSLGSPG